MVDLIDFDSDQIDQLWPRLQPVMRREAAALGINDSNYREHLRPPGFNSMARVDGRIEGIFGAIRYSGNMICCGLLCTNAINRVAIEATKLAKAFVVLVSASYPDHEIYCLPLLGEPRSRRWLELIGFHMTTATMAGVNGDTLAVMEWY